MSSSTENLLQEHLIIRRIGNIAQRCSDRLHANQDIPIEDIQIISVVIEEFLRARDKQARDEERWQKIIKFLTFGLRGETAPDRRRKRAIREKLYQDIWDRTHPRASRPEDEN